MCAAGLAVLEEVSSPAFLAGVLNMGAYFADRLERLSAERQLGQVRGRGLLLALDLGQPIGNDVVQMARDAGLLINSPRPDSLRFMPALNVTREEVDRMIVVLDAVLGSRGLTA
jgi:acetylornithine/N-succinyldiaminopimelate aminotransferase